MEFVKRIIALVVSVTMLGSFGISSAYAESYEDKVYAGTVFHDIKTAEKIADMVIMSVGANFGFIDNIKNKISESKNDAPYRVTEEIYIPVKYVAQGLDLTVTEIEGGLSVQGENKQQSYTKENCEIKNDTLFTKLDEFCEAFDKLNKVLSLIPGLLCRWTVKFLNFLDYFGLLPKSLLKLSPFHGSMIITSMGSLGIRPIYHHIYNFGNLPVFLAYGGRRSVVSCDKDGKASVKKYIELKAVTDERICDGYYYASAFKMVKRLVENPELLEKRPEQVYEDID